tara:strand:- start:3208 stop:3444 length:237 start_codon:yes stop_codon:yes gene_type:complete
MQIKDRLVQIRNVQYNTRNIVSFYKYQNPATKKFFIVLTLVAATDTGSNVFNVLYDNEKQRDNSYNSILDAFGSWSDM